MATTLRHSLVMAYAVPVTTLLQFCPPGLVLDTYGEFGFVAIAAVKAERLRPRGVPTVFGRDFALTGYRIFVRYRTADGKLRRGLHILRSDTDSRVMQVGGNVLTNYGYQLAHISQTLHDGQLHISIDGTDAVALDVTAVVDRDGSLPEGSPFAGTNDYRRFAGPLPWTIDYEAATNSLVCVRGRRGEWKPKLVDVVVHRCSFFEQPAFGGYVPQLASAFYVDEVPYSWDRGVLTPIVDKSLPPSNHEDATDE
jgi:Uncharacterized conserved protein (COG2071)